MIYVLFLLFKVMSRDNTSTRQTVITPTRKKVIRSLSRRSYKAATSSFSELPQAKNYLLKGFVHIVDKEIKTICSRKHNSILRESHENIKRFSWERIWSELDEKVPTLLKFIQCLLPKSERKFMSFLICAILKKRCMQMSLVQRAISFLLYANGTNKEVRVLVLDYCMAQNFDGRNYDGFGLENFDEQNFDHSYITTNLTNS